MENNGLEVHPDRNFHVSMHPLSLVCVPGGKAEQNAAAVYGPCHQVA